MSLLCALIFIILFFSIITSPIFILFLGIFGFASGHIGIGIFFLVLGLFLFLGE